MKNRQAIEEQVEREGFIPLQDYRDVRDLFNYVMSMDTPDIVGSLVSQLDELAKQIEYREEEDLEKLTRSSYILCGSLLEHVKAEGGTYEAKSYLFDATYDLEDAIEKEDYPLATSILAYLMDHYRRGIPCKK